MENLEKKTAANNLGNNSINALSINVPSLIGNALDIIAENVSTASDLTIETPVSC